MSLLTALLAFVPALAAKRERASEDVVDLQIGLAQAQEARDDWRRQLHAATIALEGFRRQTTSMAVEITALSRERGALLAMVRERDRVIDRLVAQSAGPPAVVGDPFAAGAEQPVFFPAPVQALPNEAFQYSQQNAQMLAMQNLQGLQAMPGEFVQVAETARELWGFCNCVPARSDMLRRRSPNLGGG